MRKQQEAGETCISRILMNCAAPHISVILFLLIYSCLTYALPAQLHTFLFVIFVIIIIIIMANCLYPRHEAIWGSRGIAPLLLNIGTRWWSVVRYTPQSPCPWERTPVTIE
jgi:hypothetical protein